VFGLALALAPVAPAGTALTRPRIVGGSVAPPAAFAGMAAIVVRAAASDTGVSCGGTVIAPYAVLTAAHCFTVPGQSTPAELMVVTGKQDLSLSGGEHLAIRAIATNPGFDPATFDHDVAVILLQTPSAATPATRATTLPPMPGTTGTVYGWGATDAAASSFPAQLQTVDLPILAMGDCTNVTMICAGTGTVSVPAPNVCIGDSGGPLLANNVLIGVTSSILVPTGAPGTCGFDSAQFADVVAEQSWINAQLKPTVSSPTMTLLQGGKLHVAWHLVPGGAAPAVSVFTSDDPLHPHTAPAGATSLDIAGLPARTPLTVSVRVQNTWGTSQATVPGTISLTGAPGLTGTAVAKGILSTQLVTNGAAVTLMAQFGPDALHLTNTGPVHIADAAVAQAVSIPLTGLQPARTYRVRLVAQSTGGTALSPLLTFTTPGVKPAVKALPKLRGTAKVGKTLTCTSGAWSGAPAPRLTFRWRIGTKVSSRFTTARLKLTTAMRGKKVACVVTARNVAGSVTVRSAAVTVRRR
jgi:trypsin